MIRTMVDKYKSIMGIEMEQLILPVKKNEWKAVAEPCFEGQIFNR